MYPYDNPAFQEALDYLYSFINFEKTPLDRYHIAKIDASRTGTMLALLDHPQRRYPSIHIAGTKGKGSTAAMCAAALRAAGLRVGLYTSPHLREFRERIRVLTPEDGDGRIPEDAFVAEIERLRPVEAQVPGVTWFEAMTIVALSYFASAEVDVAVIEVGLGGRLDATNVLEPLVSVITSLSLDHTKFLGDTLTDIAYEKGGIIKAGVPVVVAPQADEARAELARIATERQAPLIQLGRDWQFQPANHQLTITDSAAPDLVADGEVFEIALSGRYQAENAAVALAALAVARQTLPQIDNAALHAGLATTVWPGRLDVVYQADDAPTLLIDSAHNPDSAEKLSTALQTLFDYERLFFLFGAPSDKAIASMMQILFPLADGVIVAAADHPRAATPDELAVMANEQGFSAEIAPDLAAALTHAFALAGPHDLICATGSIIFIGNLLNQWDSLQSQLTAKN